MGFATSGCSGNYLQKFIASVLGFKSVWHVGRAWVVKWSFKGDKCVLSFKASWISCRRTEVSLLLKAFETCNRKRHMIKCLLRYYNLNSHSCDRKKKCCLLIAETVKALLSTNADMQLVLLPVEVITVRSHGDQQYVAFLPAGRGNAFSALKKSKSWLQNNLLYIAMQKSEFFYHMVCKKPQMNLLRCSKNFFPSKENLVVNTSRNNTDKPCSAPKIVPSSTLGEEQKGKRELKSMPTYQSVLEYCCSIQHSAFTSLSALIFCLFLPCVETYPYLLLGIGE